MTALTLPPGPAPGPAPGPGPAAARRPEPPPPRGLAAARPEFGYWAHRYRRTWRGTVVISAANPLMMIAAIGAGLGRLVDENHAAALHGASYLSFLAPGLLANAAMQTGYLEAAGIVQSSARKRGNYRAAAATPLDPGEVFLGHLGFMLMRVTVSAAVITGVLAAFGAVDRSRAILMLPAAMLTGIAFSAPVAAYAVTVTRPPRLHAVYRFAIMPMYMFSGAFFPTGQLPGWLQAVVQLTPLWHGVQLCRELSSPAPTAPAALALHAGYLAALAAVGIAFALRNYRRVLYA